MNLWGGVKPDLQYERSSFGLKKEDFVAVIIGNRLDYELSDGFLAAMDRLIQRFGMHFLIIGKISDTKRITNAVKNKQNLHFAGHLKDVQCAIRLADIYCNPPRQGGGRSGFEALVNAVPVITLKYGDVYYTCGDEFAVDRLEDYEQKIEEILYQKESRNRLKRRALLRANELSDIARIQKRALDQIFDHKKRQCHHLPDENDPIPESPPETFWEWYQKEFKSIREDERK